VDELGSASWFSIIDLYSGYHQIRLQQGEEFKTAFSTHAGHFEFTVVPFGLSGAPGTFQGAMNTTLSPLLRRCVVVFFDDILIYSGSYAEHLQHLRQVLQLLAQDQWVVKLKKCQFAKQEIHYLGHILSSQGVHTDPAKITAIQSWPVPANVRELRGFLGLAGFYRKFVRHFAIIARPLTNLLKKNTLFVWTEEHQQAFQALQQALCSAPVLGIPNFTKVFAIETDACQTGVGAVLLQDGHPLAYISKPLGVKTQGLSTYEKEYLAILIAVEQWRSYLQLAEFVIYTDQKALIHLNDQRLNTVWQQRVFSKLLGLTYRVVYKKGSDNSAADSLSRRPHPEESCRAISVVTPQWCADIVRGYSADVQATKLLTKLAANATAVPNFALVDGLLQFKHRIWVGNNPVMQQQLIQSLHSSPLGGHSGVPATIKRVQSLFAWPGLRKHVEQFVKSCATCQQAKPERVKYPGLLQPLDTPSNAWQVISLDFVEGLPISHGFDCILVVVDLFSKYAHFIALKHPYTALSVAKIFMTQIYRLHGLPTALVSDRDKIFTSQLWRELFRLAGVELRMSSAYHPQSDGQTERVNQCMETFLRCFANAIPTKWYDWLHLAEFWYNTSWHSALQQSPFYVLYGQSPRQLGLDASAACSVVSLDEWLQHRSTVQALIHQHLARAKNRMKMQADKNRTERTFNIGDWVYVKLQPYVQTSVAPRANQKLAYRFFGPYKIVSKIGTVAYKLQLPDTSTIHPVFHVSQLKGVVPVTQPVRPLPVTFDDLQVPQKVLQKRVATVGSAVRLQALIQWSGLPASMATWEDVEALRQRFPRAPAWGQAGAYPGGDVNNTPSTTAAPSSDNDDPSTAHDVVQDQEPRRGARNRRPNPKVQGPEWA
jgi:transposase InsO family protein